MTDHEDKLLAAQRETQGSQFGTVPSGVPREESMTDIVEKLRSGLHNADGVMLGGVSHDLRCLEGADEIERLRKERNALREALKQAVYEATHLSPEEDDGSHWAKMSREWLQRARAALNTQKGD